MGASPRGRPSLQRALLTVVIVFTNMKAALSHGGPRDAAVWCTCFR